MEVSQLIRKLFFSEHLECKILMEASEDGVEKWAKHRIHSSLSQRQLHEVCNCVSVCSVQRYLSLLIGILSIL